MDTVNLDGYPFRRKRNREVCLTLLHLIDNQYQINGAWSRVCQVLDSGTFKFQS